MLDFNLSVDCCGCMKCEKICPMHAISVKTDKEGFSYPEVDNEKCIKCHRCMELCEFKKKIVDTDDPVLVFAAKHKNDALRMKSSSGAVSAALSENVIQNGGVVYGAAFDSDMYCEHIRIDNKGSLSRIRGSKYVQSDMRKVYDEIICDLKDNKFVLFFGTPCQCHAIKGYTSICKGNGSLLICDIMCHGVPSPMIWKQYIDYIMHKEEGINQYVFRDKRFGWHGANITVKYNDGSIVSNTPEVRSFSNLYFSGYITRPSCHHCPYTTTKRISDITICDFWGIEKFLPEFDDDLGVSQVLINTNSGLKLFNSIEQDLLYQELDVSTCIQEQFKSPAKPNPQRDAFWNDFEQTTFKHLLRKYGDLNVKESIVRSFKNIAKRRVIYPDRFNRYNIFDE